MTEEEFAKDFDDNYLALALIRVGELRIQRDDLLEALKVCVKALKHQLGEEETGETWEIIKAKQAIEKATKTK